MHHISKPHLTNYARNLRTRQTKAESLLWQALRARRLQGYKFRRQHPISPYIVDFACVQYRLVIELDGGYHDHIVEQDQFRQAQLEADGWRVIRFCNEDVLSDVEAVLVAILRSLGVCEGV